MLCINKVVNAGSVVIFISRASLSWAGPAVNNKKQLAYTC